MFDSKKKANLGAILLLVPAVALVVGCVSDDGANDGGGSTSTGTNDTSATAPMTMTTSPGNGNTTNEPPGGDSTTAGVATTETGPTETGPTETGPTEGGSTEGGSTEGGSTEGGSTETGATESGSTDVGTAGACEGPILLDGGFEAGPQAGIWDESSTNFGTPICDPASCGDPDGPFSGDYWVWIGGITLEEAAGVTQDIVIPVEAQSLSFWLQMDVADAVSDFSLEIDGDTLFSATDADADLYGTYTQIEVDIALFADGASHSVALTGSTAGEPGVITNFFVDDVQIDCAGG